MTHEQEIKLHHFELLVRQLIQAYDEERRSNAVLRKEVEDGRKKLAEAQNALKQLQTDYDTLRTARILEVSGDDVRDARRRLARLISEVDKCIALLNV